MKRLVVRAWIGSVLALVLLPAQPGTGAVATPPAGTALATSTLLSLVTGSGTVSAAQDEARSTLASAKSAYALLVPGAAGSTAVGRTEKTSDGSGSSTETLAAHSYEVPGLVDVGLANASVATSIGSNITSAVNIDLGAVDMLDGFVTIDGGSSDTSTLVNATQSRVQRSITISGLHTFSLADLFQEMGASPLDMTCNAVQDVGAEIGVDTATACADLASAEQAVDDGKTLLSGAASEMLDAKNAVIDQIATETANAASIASDIASAESDRVAAAAALAAAEADRDEAVASRDALVSEMDALTADRDDLESQTSGLDRDLLQAERDAQAAICPTLIVQALIDACNDAVAAYDAQLALFDQLDDLDAQIAAKQAEIDAANDDVTSKQAAVDAAQAAVDALDASIATLNADLATAQALLVTLNDDLDGLIAGLAVLDPVSGVEATCDTVDDALAAVENQLPSLAAAAGTARTTAASACATIRTEVEALIDTPLISLDGVDIHIDALAQADDPTIVVSGTAGRVQVGNLDPVGLDLDLVGTNVGPVQDAIQEKLNDVMTLTGLDLPLPQFLLMVTDRDSGKDSNGKWYSRGSVTALQIVIPAATFDLPSASPMEVIANETTLPAHTSAVHGGSGGGFGSGQGGGASTFATTTSPIVFNVGTFNAQSSFTAATSGGGGGGGGGGSGGSGGSGSGSTTFKGAGSSTSLPYTGVGTMRQFALGLLLVVAGLWVTRALRTA